MVAIATRRSKIRLLFPLKAINAEDIAQILGIRESDVGNDLRWLREHGDTVVAPKPRRTLRQVVELWQLAMRFELPSDVAPYRAGIIAAMEEALNLVALEQRARKLVPRLLPGVAVAHVPCSPPAWEGSTTVHWQVLYLLTDTVMAHFPIVVHTLNVRNELLHLPTPIPVHSEDIAQALALQFLARETERTESDALLTEPMADAIDRAIKGLSEAQRSVVIAYLNSRSKTDALSRIARTRRCSRENTNQLYHSGMDKIRAALASHMSILRKSGPPAAVVRRRERNHRYARA